MEELNHARARDEALKRRSGSANRNRFWASLNRYLAAQVEHNHKVAKKEQDETEQPDKGRHPGSRASQ